MMSNDDLDRMLDDIDQLNVDIRKILTYIKGLPDDHPSHEVFVSAIEHYEGRCICHSSIEPCSFVTGNLRGIDNDRC